MSIFDAIDQKNKKIFKAYDLVLLFLKKKLFLFWVWPVGTCFLHKLGQKMVICRGFSKKFFRTTGLQLKFFILIEFPDTFHWKAAKKIKVDVVLGQIWAKLGLMLSGNL